MTNYHEKLLDLYWILETCIQVAAKEGKCTYGRIQDAYEARKDAYQFIQDTVLEMLDGNVYIGKYADKDTTP